MTTPITPGERTRIRLRRAWAADWDRVNPVLGDGEPGFDKTNNMLKIGDGVTPWRQLTFLTPPEDLESVDTSGGASDAAVYEHIVDESPHPIYDDGPSLLLLWQNAKL